MKIVVTSLGESLDSPVDQRFGRARFFILYELENGAWSAHDNQRNLKAAQGAGVRAAQAVAALGAQAVVTGHCGPRAAAALAAAAVAVCQEASGSVRDAVNAYQAGLLKRTGGDGNRHGTENK